MSKDISNGKHMGPEFRMIGLEKKHKERYRERNMAIWTDYCRGMRLIDIAAKYDRSVPTINTILRAKCLEFLGSDNEYLKTEIERLKNINTALENEIALQRMLLKRELAARLKKETSKEEDKEAEFLLKKKELKKKEQLEVFRKASNLLKNGGVQ